MKTEQTTVIFRKYPDGDIIALFQYMNNCSPSRYLIESYMHVGQHSAADYNMVISATKPAKPAEYLPLFQELETIGYKMVIKQRAQRNKMYKL